MTISEQAVEAAAKAHYETQPEYRERFEGGREPIPFAELPEGSRRYRLRNQRIALEAALPLLGVQRPEDVARVICEAMDDRPNRSGPYPRCAEGEADAALSVPVIAEPNPAPQAGCAKEGAVTPEMVTAFMREFEKWSPLLRYKEAEGWHTVDHLGVQHGLACALSASPPPPVAESGWQPIETAPKDGEYVDLGSNAIGRIADCQWNGATWISTGANGTTAEVPESFITHWMYRPASPPLVAEERGRR